MVYDILINLFSDVIFIFLLLIIFWLVWYWPALSKAKQFFGAKELIKINIFISVHEDMQTTTRNVVTVEEFEVANYLKGTVNRQLKDSVFGRIADFISGLLGFNPRIPDIYISTGNIDSEKVIGGAIAIGGPVRNVVSRMILNEGNSWITYNEDEHRFQINKGPQAGELIEQSEGLSILEKIKINDASVILAYGFGEVHTRIAVEYLANNWYKLYRLYKQEEFALCFTQDADGAIQTVEEFVGNSDK